MHTITTNLSADPARIRSLHRGAATSMDVVHEVIGRNREVEIRAAAIANDDPHLHGHCRSVEFRCDGDYLLLRGCLPSYYLKQVAQEAVRRLAGSSDLKIVNEIDVQSFNSDLGDLDLSNRRKPR